MLEIKNLTVSIENKLILDNLSLTVKAGEVAAIMGPNGSGKSTLSYVIAGKEDYEVTGGEVLLDGENILELSPDERAAKGLFLAFQYPIEIPGVATMTFLKAALNALARQRGEKELTTPDFIRRVRGAADRLKIDQEMLKRPLEPVEFPIPAGATADGELTLSWTQGSGSGGTGRGCQVAALRSKAAPAPGPAARSCCADAMLPARSWSKPCSSARRPCTWLRIIWNPPGPIVMV